jgi:hypothetical protein
MNRLNVTDLEDGLGDSLKIECLDRRLEMGVWFFNTHGGETECCGAGNYQPTAPNPDLPDF